MNFDDLVQLGFIPQNTLVLMVIMEIRLVLMERLQGLLLQTGGSNGFTSSKVAGYYKMNGDTTTLTQCYYCLHHGLLLVQELKRIA
jgi:hypothetical protein